MNSPETINAFLRVGAAVLVFWNAKRFWAYADTVNERDRCGFNGTVLRVVVGFIVAGLAASWCFAGIEAELPISPGHDLTRIAEVLFGGGM